MENEANKGVLYVMSSGVDGLIKIGKTGNFENRMRILEANGYCNLTGMKREFAIEVDDYDVKEKLVHQVFASCHAGKTEIFAVDKDLVISLLSSFDGTQIYPDPKEVSQKAVFENAADEITKSLVPDGEYTLNTTMQDHGEISATMEVKDGKFIVKKGSFCAPITDARHIPEIRYHAKVENNHLIEDIACASPSTAAVIVRGKSSNGWVLWKNAKGDPISIYRTKGNED